MIALICVLITNNVTAQMRLINEVETDNPVNNLPDTCEYVELRSAPGAVLPANTYFISVEGQEVNFAYGRVTFVANVSGVTFNAASGLITVLNMNSTCPGRTYGTSTIVPAAQTQGFLQNGTSTYFLLTLPAGSPAPIATVTDYDPNDDGVINLPTGTVVHDSFGFFGIIGVEGEFVYGPNVNPSLAQGPENPDAFVRFSSNNSPNSASAFYFGELNEAGGVTTTMFSAAPAERSANFPANGQLTPGLPNVP